MKKISKKASIAQTAVIHNDVIIEDDGCGFNPNEKKNDGRKHVGIESVRSRLRYMLGGTLTIHSEIGKGTRVVIEIPGKEIE